MTINSLNHLNDCFNALANLIRIRIKDHFSDQDSSSGYTLPSLDTTGGPLAEFILQHKLGIEEHYILIIALTPHIRPDFFDTTIKESLPQPGDFPQIGGTRGKQFRGFIPTGETALFISL